MATTSTTPVRATIPLPKFQLEPLPDVVTKRFPELRAWERSQSVRADMHAKQTQEAILQWLNSKGL